MSGWVAKNIKYMMFALFGENRREQGYFKLKYCACIMGKKIKFRR